MSKKIYPSLKGMAEGKVEGVTKVTKFTVDVFLVLFEAEFNGRPINQAHVDTFKETKRNGGTWPEIVVRVDNGNIYVVEGHHRVVAQRQLVEEDESGETLAGLEATQFRGSNADRITLMVTSQQALLLTPLQLAAQYRKLITLCGWTEPAIAKRIGKSGQHVRDMLTLVNSDSDVQTMVTNNEVAAHVAVKMVKKHGSGAGKVLAEGLKKAKAEGKTKVTNKTVAGVSLVDAIKREMQSGGAILAETLCPEHLELIMYMRASGVR